MHCRRWGALMALGVAATVCLSASTSSVHAATAKKGKKKVATTKPASGSAAAIARGKSLVAASGCTGCHKIDGKGGTTGPDLSHVGAHLKSSEIAAQIKNPKAKNPNSIMPPSPRPDKEISQMAAYLASLK